MGHHPGRPHGETPHDPTWQPRPLLSPDDIARLREALATADFTSAGIAARIGPVATAAAARGDHRAALRAAAARDRLATLVRLFVCHHPEPVDAVARALAPLPLDAARAAGLVEPHPEGLAAAVDLEPYGERWWVVSDLPATARPGRPLPADHVLGVGGASTTLAGVTVRRPVGAALDLGTGCGVQALHLATHAGAVTATDVNRRALRFAATTAALNGQSWELRHGDLAAPVAGRRFDLVVSNPPFVVGPGRTSHVYRDSGREGDRLGAELAGLAPSLLTDGGIMQYLANWAYVAGQDWRERVASWFAGTGCDAWVIQREVTDPLSYVRLWLTDAGQGDDTAEAWLDWFDTQKIEAVGFGVVTLRRAGRDQPVVRVEDLRQPLSQPFGPHVAAWLDRQDWLRGRDTAGLLDECYVAPAGVRLHQVASRSSEGWVVDRQLLELTDGAHRVEAVDPLIADLVAAAGGRIRVRDQLAVVAAAYQIPEEELTATVPPVLARLVEWGFLVPAELSGAHPGVEVTTDPVA